MLTAHRVRTSFALAGAAGTIVAALFLHSRPAPVGSADVADDGMKVEAKLVSAKILPGAKDYDLAVTITAPGQNNPTRPPLSLVVVLDRSGSMAGEPIANAKAAAGRLIEQLDGGDAFALVTFSSSDETVVPMGRATEDHKRRALAAVQTITDEGGTCISCGIVRGESELARSPIRGLRRMVLMSDGQANEGIFDRGELVQLAAETGNAGISISTVGVGLDFDEVTMQRLANVGRGNYYFVENTRDLGAMFSRELGGLADTVASQVKLVLTDSDNARIVEAYGYPLERAGSHVIIPIADLRAGETRKVVVRVQLAPPGTGVFSFTGVELGWQRVADGAARHAVTSASAEVVDDAAEVADSMDPTTVQAVESALTGRALEEANQVYDTHGADAARQVLELRAAQIGANKYLDGATSARLRRTNDEALDTLRTAPAAKAKKVNAGKAYELAR